MIYCLVFISFVMVDCYFLVGSFIYLVCQQVWLRCIIGKFDCFFRCLLKVDFFELLQFVIIMCWYFIVFDSLFIDWQEYDYNLVFVLVFMYYFL